MPKDTHSTLPAHAELVLPEQVTVALAELAGAARDGLLALAVGTGLQVLCTLLDAEVDRLVGPRGRHNSERVPVRHGTQPGQVTLGGRRVRVDCHTQQGRCRLITAWAAPKFHGGRDILRRCATSCEICASSVALQGHRSS